MNDARNAATQVDPGGDLVPTSSSSPSHEPMSAESPDLVTLDRLDSSVCGLIAELDAAGPELDRLKMMGVCAARRAHVVKHGDPMIVRVLGVRIGLTRGLASCVRVVPVAPRPDCESKPADTDCVF
jgi:Fe2+ transport system protein FeoA